MIQSQIFCYFMLLIVFQASYSQRRIKDGEEVTTDKKYMVYLLRADSEINKYEGWLCGGAIISKDYVITSAACVQDVQNIYVIAGYKKYVTADKMKDDECIKQKKKKVVLTCVPKMYHLHYNKTELWARADIAVIKVETSFDFNDTSYETVCSYTPQAIKFNVEVNFPKPEDDVIALGWGHSDKFRVDSDLIDMNLPTLHYAPTSVLDPEYCVRYFEGNKALAKLITWSMICTLMRGNLDDKGKLRVRSRLAAQGCIPEALVLRGAVGPRCDDDARAAAKAYGETIDEPELNDYDLDEALINNTRLRTNYNKAIARDNTATTPKTTPIPTTKPTMKAATTTPTTTTEQEDEETDLNDSGFLTGEETPGICQNDHGGPLIAWRGGKEILVGVAALFRLDSNQNCIGPYLFTKTWCNAVFINCIINQENRNYTQANFIVDRNVLHQASLSLNKTIQQVRDKLIFA